MHWHLNTIVGQSAEALRHKLTFPDANLSRWQRCRLLQSEALKRRLPAPSVAAPSAPGAANE